MELYIIVGLGNPGEQYRNNRHNLGFMVIDKIAEAYNIKLQNKFSGELGAIMVDAKRVLLFKPLTFMNKSGEPLQKLCNFYRDQDPKLLVIYDDIELPLATLKLKFAGGAGGHNGIRSISQSINPDYWRMRLGIGRGPQGVAEYVLSNFSQQELLEVRLMVDGVANRLSGILNELSGAIKE